MQMAWPTMLTGTAMVMFFVPVTGLAMASVNPEEQASAAGLSNFMRTLAGAFATSLIQTGWSNAERTNQSALSGIMRTGRIALQAIEARGVDAHAATGLLTNLVESQSLMLATLNMFGVITICLLLATGIIWFAPKPKGAIDTSGAH